MNPFNSELRSRFAKALPVSEPGVFFDASLTDNEKVVCTGFPPVSDKEKSILIFSKGLYVSLSCF